MKLTPLTETFATTRDSLQRVATHVLAHRRHDLCGKFGLRATPGGIGTPACGPDHEVVRIAGTVLIRERTGSDARTTSLDLTTATLAEAAALVSVDLTTSFEAGGDTPPTGDATAPLDIDPDAAAELAEWYRFAWAALDTTLAALEPGAEPSVAQLWPEHFDVGCDVGAAPGHRVNLGASPGDGFSSQPYIYVGPWDTARPGDPDYWNAPFGAVLTHDELRASADPIAAARAFLLRGVTLFAQ
jgi:hypothetical protein